MPQLSAIKPNDTILSEQAGFRRAMACSAFWSDHPLNVTFDRHARPARDAKVRKLARIIRDNVASARRVNEAAGKPVMPDGGARAKQAIQALSRRAS